MATRKKKTRVLDEDDGMLADHDHMVIDKDIADHADSSELSEDDSYDDEEEMDMDVEKVDVEFEARNPEEDDFHGIRQLLLQLFLRTKIDLSALTNVILSQKHVGSVIKQYLDVADIDDEDDDIADDNSVFGVISCLSLTHNKEAVCCQQLREHVMEKLSGDKQASTNFSHVMNNPENRVGFIINERFINIPAQIAVPSFDSLCKEMEVAKKKGEDFNFTHYLLIAKKFRMKTSKSGKKRRSAKPMDQEIYSNGEEEYFAEDAVFKASYTVAGERDSGVVQQWDSELEEQYEPLREVLIVDADKLASILRKIGEALSQSS